jgi:RimJ/RimL family protein N-acetyltransferase
MRPDEDVQEQSACESVPCVPVALLKTERLALRPFRAEDIDAYAAMCADPDVMRFLSPGGKPLSREDAWRQMAMYAGHWQLRGYGMWAVEDRSTGIFIGRIGLLYPEGWPDRELAWALARPFWGRGFATEGARVALAHAFESLGWDHLISLIHPRNKKSVHVAERIGASFRGFAYLRGVRHRVYRSEANAWRSRTARG